jgi:hypothetical protein
MWDGSKWVIDTNGFSSSGGSGGLTVEVIATTTTATASKHYLADTTSAAFTVTLPVGVTGAIIKFSDASRTWGVNNLTVTPSTGQKIDGLAINETLVCNTAGGWIQLTYNGSTWVVDSNAYAAGSVPTFAPDVIGGILPAAGTPGHTNGAAVAAGYVGEIKHATTSPTSVSFVADSIGYEVCSLPITAGVWMINASTYYAKNATNAALTDYVCLVNTTAGSNLTNANSGYNYVNTTKQVPLDYLNATLSVTTVIRCDGTNCILANGVSMAGTTLYVHAYSSQRGASTITGGGFIMAVRIA